MPPVFVADNKIVLKKKGTTFLYLQLTFLLKEMNYILIEHVSHEFNKINNIVISLFSNTGNNSSPHTE